MFVKAEIWTVGKTESGMAALLRLPDNSRCVPVSLESFEAQNILLSLSGIQEDPPGWTELMAAFSRAVAVKPESVEILRSEIPRKYRAVVHFRGENTHFTLNSRTPEALALAVRTGVPIFLEDSIPEEDSIAVSMAEPEAPFSLQLKRLQAELKRKVAREEYEEAANLRDRIKQIEERMRSVPE